jgi:hypothetical protein
MEIARENLRSPLMFLEEAERSQDFSFAKDSRTSSRRGNHCLEVEPTQGTSKNSALAKEQSPRSQTGEQVSTKRKHKEEFRDEAESEVSKRPHMEEDSDFIHRRTLELAQVYAQPEFEFPGGPLTPHNATAPAPSIGNLEVIEVVCESEAFQLAIQGLYLIRWGILSSHTNQIPLTRWKLKLLKSENEVSSLLMRTSCLAPWVPILTRT